MTRHDVLVSDVADYEARRDLLRSKSTRGVEQLDEVVRYCARLPVSRRA